MSASDAFLDTNVLLYLLSADAERADRAESLVAGGGTISVQVLNEFASVAVRKFSMPIIEIREVLGLVRAICDVVPVSGPTHDRGLAICERYGFSIHDSMIVAAALLAGCKVLFTEDLQDGQLIDEQLTVRNPFRAR